MKLKRASIIQPVSILMVSSLMLSTVFSTSVLSQVTRTRTGPNGNSATTIWERD